MILPRLTPSQEIALVKLADEARSYGVELASQFRLSFAFTEETRPGRGHDVEVFFVDGDHVVTAYLDVYGNGSGINVGSIDWIHSGADEDCQCDHCIAEADRCDILDDWLREVTTTPKEKHL